MWNEEEEIEVRSNPNQQQSESSGIFGFITRFWGTNEEKPVGIETKKGNF